MTIFGLMEPLHWGTFLLKTCQGNLGVCFMESSIEPTMLIFTSACQFWLCSFTSYPILTTLLSLWHRPLTCVATPHILKPFSYSPHPTYTLSSSCCPFLMAGKREEIELLSIWICEQEFVVATNAHPSTRMCNSSSAHHTYFGSLLLLLCMVNWIHSKHLSVFVTTWLQYVLIPFRVFRYFGGFSENVISKSFEISS